MLFPMLTLSQIFTLHFNRKMALLYTKPWCPELSNRLIQADGEELMDSQSQGHYCRCCQKIPHCCLNTETKKIK